MCRSLLRAQIFPRPEELRPREQFAEIRRNISRAALRRTTHVRSARNRITCARQFSATTAQPIAVDVATVVSDPIRNPAREHLMVPRVVGIARNPAPPEVAARTRQRMAGIASMATAAHNRAVP